MLYISACETRYGILCYIFPHVEFGVIFFRMWNLVLYFPACGTCSGILCYIYLPCFLFFFSTSLKLSLIYSNF